MNLFDLVEIDATHPPIEHTGMALLLKESSIKGLREKDPSYISVPDETVWEILRRKPVSFDLLTLYVGAMSDLIQRHEERLDRLDPPPQ